MRSALVTLLLVLVFGHSLARTAETAPRPFLSPIFSDAMVLQRGRSAPIWGWTAPGATVTVEIADHRTTATAGPDGRWQAALTLPPPGGPYTVTLSGPEARVLHDVLVGDVWLCGGQSNMQFALRDAIDGPAEVARATHPQVRLLKMTPHSAYAPVEVPDTAGWRICGPDTVADFSAVAYYFARDVQARLGAPVGLVQCALGGSPAESWMSAHALATIGEFPAQIAEIKRLHATGAPTLGSFLMHWLAEHDHHEAWAQPEADDHDWASIRVPGAFAELGVADTPAVVWLRREIDLPAEWDGAAATLKLGSIEKMDTTYVNGRWVGASSWVENPRAYTIPAGLLHAGRNTLAIRVFKLRPKGGFIAAPEALRLERAGTAPIPLAGDWRGRVSVDARPPYPLPLDVENYPTMPTVLAQGMLDPLAPLSLAGALWYQGEANTAHPAQYQRLLPALIADWRARFAHPTLPFYVVGLPAFLARPTAPGTDGWAELREAQAWTVSHTPHTGLAITIDTGDATDIHPKDKATVGHRLALHALADHYGQSIAADGPTYRRHVREGSTLRVFFDHAEGGLVAPEGKPTAFALAGPDQVWHWADATIDGETVVLRSIAVPEPTDIRYAWAANPGVTLTNRAGLPAAPFRTDDAPLTH